MINEYKMLENGTWFLVSADVPYLLQNAGEFDVLIKATDSSTTAPMHSSASFVLEPKGLVNDTILAGNIWARNKKSTDNVLVTYAK